LQEIPHFIFCSPRSLGLQIADLENTHQHAEKHLRQSYRLKKYLKWFWSINSLLKRQESLRIRNLQNCVSKTRWG